MIDTTYEIRPIEERNREQVKKWFISRWKTDFLVSKGQKHFFDDLQGFLALDNGRILGIATFRNETSENSTEVISLDSFQENIGIGSTLIRHIVDLASQEGKERIWLVTTNDNTNALRFYQKRGWNMIHFYRDAVEKARVLKPSIPETGKNGIPILHEIELEIQLT
ncbi:MAG: GNAT family N-acetyltransferase [Saprospiraceae bacterium]|nr:GNAT family N-acetyltransferase [Saprospiraceae bacterium]